MVKIRKKDSKIETFWILRFVLKHKILVPDFNSCTEPGEMLVSRPKGWQFVSFWVKMHQLCSFLGHFVFLWAKNFLCAEFCMFHSTIDNKVRAFVSVSVGYSDEMLTQSRDYLTHMRSMSENNTYCA